MPKLVAEKYSMGQLSHKPHYRFHPGCLTCSDIKYNPSRVQDSCFSGILTRSICWGHIQHVQHTAPATVIASSLAHSPINWKCSILKDLEQAPCLSTPPSILRSAAWNISKLTLTHTHQEAFSFTEWTDGKGLRLSRLYPASLNQFHRGNYSAF